MYFKTKYFLLSLFLLLISCNQKEIYFQYNTISSQQLSKDSSLHYNVRVADKTKSYNFFINVRHTGNYPYQNIWLFLQQTNPNKSITNDSIEAYLANEYGKWLGTGVGSLKEMQILYKQQLHFPDTGLYRITLRHGMRDSILQGINDIGIRIAVAD